MKKIVIILLLVIFSFCISQSKADINLDEDMSLQKLVQVVKIQSLLITKEIVQVHIVYKAADNSVVAEERLYIRDSDYTALANTTITESDVDKKLFTLINRVIQAKVKALKNFEGSED